MEKNCLVTGGAGFVGSHVTDRLIEQGHNVYVMDNLSTGNLDNLNPEAKFIKGDITDRIMTYPFDYIFHLAAKARVQLSIDHPEEWNDTNVGGTLKVFEAARRSDAKVIYASSSSVYGESVFLPTPEEAPLYPKSPYALQKHIGEQYLKLYNQLYGVDYTILRYFSVYGERQIEGGAYSTVIGTFLKQRELNQPLTIRGDGESRRDFTYVGDVARATVDAMDWSRDVYNIGRGRNYSVNEIARAIGGKTVRLEAVDEPSATLADNMKARDAGWEPKMDVFDWIKNA